MLRFCMRLSVEVHHVRSILFSGAYRLLNIMPAPGEVRLGKNSCLDVSSSAPKLSKCDGGGGFQRWSFLGNAKQVRLG